MKGTQNRSPAASIQPKPSLVMSIVVRIARSPHSASVTYQAWNAHTSASGPLTAPVSCAQQEKPLKPLKP